MINVLYTNAASPHNKIPELLARAALNMLDISGAIVGVMDNELAIARYRLFRNDLADGRKIDEVAIMVKYSIPAVSHSLPDIPLDDVVTCVSDPPYCI